MTMELAEYIVGIGILLTSSIWFLGAMGGDSGSESAMAAGLGSLNLLAGLMLISHN